MCRGNREGFQNMHREGNGEGKAKRWIQLKSGMCYYCKRENHIMVFDGPKIIGTGHNKHHGWIKEAIRIWKHATGTVNWDERSFLLSYTWEAVLKKSGCKGQCYPTLTDRKHATATSHNSFGMKWNHTGMLKRTLKIVKKVLIDASLWQTGCYKWKVRNEFGPQVNIY